MEKRRWNQRKKTYESCSEGLRFLFFVNLFGSFCVFEAYKLSFVLAEVTSIEWTAVTMSEEEEDLILRMYKLVGDRLNSMCALLLTVSLFGLELRNTVFKRLIS